MKATFNIDTSSTEQRKEEENCIMKLDKQRDAEIEALEKSDPCIRLDCIVHPDHRQNMCKQIQRHIDSIKYLQETIESFDMTLQQMVHDKQDHTNQYLDDLNKLKELKSQNELIEEELIALSPCPVKNCTLHLITDENTHMETDSGSGVQGDKGRSHLLQLLQLLRKSESFQMSLQ
ncbi:hypothetical protein HNY73_021326 [Argiope bruennichi]|uniref:Uncharacterized protein n=1 Tax=Argiope bruennichi TaxID=94029 RepID=A0A8T0DZH7_ARGBR|nr:hypothetical protein HNY73_021326 [Argiope bruennichi]